MTQQKPGIGQPTLRSYVGSTPAEVVREMTDAELSDRIGCHISVTGHKTGLLAPVLFAIDQSNDPDAAAREFMQQYRDEVRRLAGTRAA